MLKVWKLYSLYSFCFLYVLCKYCCKNGYNDGVFKFCCFNLLFYIKFCGLK